MTIAVTPEPPRQQAGRNHAWQLGMAAIALLAGAGLLAEYGFYVPLVAAEYCQAAQAAAVLLFVATQVVQAWRCTDAGHWIGRCWIEAAAGPLAAVAGAIAMGAPVVMTAVTAGAIYVVLRQSAVWAQSLARRAMQATAATLSRWQPVRLIAGTYLLLTLLGGVLLALPAATVSDHRNSPYTHLLNSLFLAASAATGTGLSVYDFASEYTLFGKIVALVLMQAGGLAIMIFGTLFGLVIVWNLWPQETAATGPWDPKRLGRLVAAIVVTTFALEAIGAALLYPLFSTELGAPARSFHAAFLAISAFCNGGLCLDRNSLIDMAGFWQVYEVILPLMVLGGIGFPVLYEIGWRAIGAGRGSKPMLSVLPLPADRWSLHTRLVLGMTLCLIVVGALGMVFFETRWDHGGFWYSGNTDLLNKTDAVQASAQSMSGHSTAQRFYDGLFQSAAARTTGFKTVLVKPGSISPGSLTLMMGLMVIGGSPGSTAGGLHTVPMAILIVTVVSALRGRSRSSIGGSVIPERVVPPGAGHVCRGNCLAGVDDPGAGAHAAQRLPGTGLRGDLCLQHERPEPGCHALLDSHQQSHASADHADRPHGLARAHAGNGQRRTSGATRGCYGAGGCGVRSFHAVPRLV